MSSLIGEYNCKLDDKGRVKIPADLKRKLIKFSAEGQDQFVVKRGFEGCLELFPMSKWEVLRARVEKRMNPFDPKHRKFLRNFLNGVKEVMLDSADRLLIPGNLLSDAGITTELVIVAQFDRMELWQADSLRKAKEDEGDTSFSDLAAEVMGDFRNDDI
jgi:MraZ protein